MKIYTMRGLFVGDDNPYKNMTAQDPRKYANVSVHDINQGVVLEMKWAVDVTDKPIGDFIMIPGSGFTTRVETVAQFKKFAPHNTVTKIKLNDSQSEFAVLQPINHPIDAKNLEHIFMMFTPYKYMLVTQLVKEEWERRSLTGAAFSKVAEMDDDRFIKID